MGTQDNTLAESGSATLTDAEWSEARRRAAVIGPLVEAGNVTQAAADEAGRQLGFTGRTVYSLVKVWKASGGSVPALIGGKRDGGRGRSRLEPEIEKQISEAVREHYLTRQKPKPGKVVAEVRRRCRLLGLKVPATNTILARIEQIRPDKALAKREGSKAAQRLKPAPGRTPEVLAPLDVIQMDHTKVDIILVDPKSRQPIGRPFLTIAIDEFSRCIAGFCVTLDPPSATSVGLCLTHVASEKKPWLDRIGADCTWPMRGKPKRLYVDNGREFHSEGLRRGCEAHGIKLDHRPIARPHYGGIIERVIGTAMRMIHELPGSTFSNIKERGSYNSDARAALTLEELEKWIALAICGPYHNEVHSTLLEPPAAKWASGIAQFGEPIVAANPTAFLVDFLPVVHRQVQRVGFVINGITYYASAVSAWIARKDQDTKYLIRYDPRDLSRIWVLDPTRQIYIEVPYRNLSNLPVTTWEHRAARKRLREEGRTKVDESAVMRTVAQMRSVVDEAATKSRAARRANARRSHLPQNTEIPVPALPDPAATTPSSPAQPFTEMEEW